jgi:hypothetical protein
MTSIELVPNVDDPERWCPACGNIGWVELAGSRTLHGITYSMGSAPCKWCQEGRARYLRAVGQPRDKHDHHRPWRPAERFTAADIIMVGDRDPRPGRSQGPLIRTLPGLDDAPVRDLEQGARSTYAAWRKVLPKELADARLRQQTGAHGVPLDRQTYPLELAEQVIAEYEALAETSSMPNPTSTDQEEPI